ncbi:chorismate mutase [Albimonas sp. CAU 1670]|uniref:chorismate mutase n=1 Tax=Albimonas sp. CAU 1670 TaxID=3032599 RepID=UPI0023DC13C2|nr:chorismate mutase [Albimonas sp. CAU 1670]MDF2232483.1 chorismate mutase [Albimonas sp. CAU 1670]
MTETAKTARPDAGQEPEHVVRAREVLAKLRGDIDNLDAILVYTLAQRFKATQAVGRLKAEHDLPPADPDREARQVARLRQLSNDSGLDPEFAEAFLAFIIQEVIRHHEKLQS